MDGVRLTRAGADRLAARVLEVVSEDRSLAEVDR
jgi:hypothetical protein